MAQLLKSKTSDVASTLICMCEKVATRGVWSHYSKIGRDKINFLDTLIGKCIIC